MSSPPTIWKILWDRAAQAPDGREGFEVDEVVPAVAGALTMPEDEAKRRIDGLMGELARMPAGRQYFTLEGWAIVPLAEFRRSAKGDQAAMEAYPFEV